MGFNRRKMEADRKAKADATAIARRATHSQVVEDAERLIAVWNERQARRMPLLFAIRTDNRRRHRSPLLVPVGALPGLPNHQRHRPTVQLWDCELDAGQTLGNQFWVNPGMTMVPEPGLGFGQPRF